MKVWRTIKLKCSYIYKKKNMKKIISLCLALFLATVSFSQQDSTSTYASKTNAKVLAVHDGDSYVNLQTRLQRDRFKPVNGLVIQTRSHLS